MTNFVHNLIFNMDSTRSLLSKPSKDVEFQDVFYTVDQRANFCEYEKDFLTFETIKRYATMYKYLITML